MMHMTSYVRARRLHCREKSTYLVPTILIILPHDSFANRSHMFNFVGSDERSSL
jgi:hypothetical protein